MIELQIIDGKFYTKPPEPVEIPRSDVEALLQAALNKKSEAETNKANAVASKDSTIAQLNATIDAWDAEIINADSEALNIQGWLDQVPE